MADPLTLQTVNTMLAAIQLPEGQTVERVYQDEAEQWMVGILDNVELQSRVVTLESLTGPYGTRLNMPGVLRGETAEAVCTAHDPSLDQCFDVSPENLDENLDEILRQLASCDATQAHEAFEALEYLRDQARSRGPQAERDLEQKIAEAMERIRLERGAAEAQTVERNYEDYERGEYRQPELPPQTTQGQGVSANGGSQGSSGGNGSAGGGSQGGAAPVIDGAVPGGGPVSNGDVQAVAFVPAASDAILTGTAFVADFLPAANADGYSPPTVKIQSEDADASVPVPSPFYVAPVTVSLQSHQIPEFIGRASISDGTQFFQTLFTPMAAMAGPQASPVTDFLTDGSPETRSYVEAVRRSTADVLRNYWTQQRMESVADAHQPLTLTYRYDTVARGIVISMEPAGTRSGREAVADDAQDEDSSPFDRFRRFTGVSLATFRVGVDGVRREPELSTYPSAVVLIPFAVFAGVRPGIDVRVNPTAGHLEGAATDRAATRVAHRGNSGEHRGGEGRDDSRDGRSRGQGGRQGQHQQDQNEDEEAAVA